MTPGAPGRKYFFLRGLLYLLVFWVFVAKKNKKKRLRDVTFYNRWAFRSEIKTKCIPPTMNLSSAFAT